MFSHPLSSFVGSFAFLDCKLGIVILFFLEKVDVKKPDAIETELNSARRCLSMSILSFMRGTVSHACVMSLFNILVTA